MTKTKTKTKTGCLEHPILKFKDDEDDLLRELGQDKDKDKIQHEGKTKTNCLQHLILKFKYDEGHHEENEDKPKINDMSGLELH